MEDSISPLLPQEADFCLCGQGDGRVFVGSAPAGWGGTRRWSCPGGQEEGAGNGQGGEGEKGEGCTLAAAHSRLPGFKSWPIHEFIMI